MKNIKIGTLLLRIGLVMYILGNFYFGWNEKPMSDLELYVDNTVKFCIYVGITFYLMPIWSIYENYVKKHK